MERPGLSLINGLLALVTHPLITPLPAISLYATWFSSMPPPTHTHRQTRTASFLALQVLLWVSLQRTQKKIPTPVCLALAPLIHPPCLCPSLFCAPLPHPEGTHYPSPTHSPRHCCSICQRCFHWPVTPFHFPSDCLWIIHAPNSPII